MKNKFITLPLLLLTILIYSFPVYADIGPKPSMSFNLIYETSQEINLIDGEQYQCSDKDCADIKPLGEFGPQRLRCSQSSCHSLAYGYSPYQKLVLNFSDKNRESNVFNTNSFNSNFNVKVTESQLIIEDVTPLLSRGETPYFLNALILTVVLELLTALIYLSRAKISKKVLASVFVANIISLPIVWFVFPILQNPFLILVLSEIFAVVFEMYFIHVLNKRSITLKQSFKLSLIMNLVSLFLGGTIFVSSIFAL
ncbi:hypothetical protein HZA97_09430 [Candidatus Woesearchaeota archaeon]|nr:hypothetical protein [Candidatus Woesearchaeota archaeon]